MGTRTCWTPCSAQTHSRPLGPQQRPALHRVQIPPHSRTSVVPRTGSAAGRTDQCVAHELHAHFNVALFEGQPHVAHAPRTLEAQQLVVESRLGHPASVSTRRTNPSGHRQHRVTGGESSEGPERSALSRREQRLKQKMPTKREILPGKCRSPHPLKGQLLSRCSHSQTVPGCSWSSAEIRFETRGTTRGLNAEWRRKTHNDNALRSRRVGSAGSPASASCRTTSAAVGTTAAATPCTLP